MLIVIFFIGVLTDATFGIIVFVAMLLLGYIARELCPRGPIFTSIELDEIRLDRLDDIESSLKDDINSLKVDFDVCPVLISLTICQFNFYSE